MNRYQKASTGQSEFRLTRYCLVTQLSIWLYLIADIDLYHACLQFGSRSRILLIVMSICVHAYNKASGNVNKKKANDKSFIEILWKNGKGLQMKPHLPTVNCCIVLSLWFWSDAANGFITDPTGKRQNPNHSPKWSNKLGGNFAVCRKHVSMMWHIHIEYQWWWVNIAHCY